MLVVGYNQNVGRSSLGLLSVYNVVANDSEIVGAARLNGSGVISNRAGSNLVPGVVDLNFLRSRRLNRSNLGGNYIDLSNSNVVRSGVGLIGNYSPVVLSVAFVNVIIVNIVGANAIGDGDGLGASIGDLANLSRGINNGISLVVAVGINQSLQCPATLSIAVAASRGLSLTEVFVFGSITFRFSGSSPACTRCRSAWSSWSWLRPPADQQCR